jgi:glycosyltransferase involved in cell wall biosynthesis
MTARHDSAPGASSGAGTEFKKLSVLIPCYNEEATLREIVDRVCSAPVDLEREIIVVDDGSVDSSREIMTELAEKGLIRPISCPRIWEKGLRSNTR